MKCTLLLFVGRVMVELSHDIGCVAGTGVKATRVKATVHSTESATVQPVQVSQGQVKSLFYQSGPS